MAISFLEDQRVFIDHGPIQMVIDAERDGRSAPDIALKSAEEVLRQFEELVRYIPDLKKLKTYTRPSAAFPDVLNKMILAVESTLDPDLNTLAAVAGSFSEIAVNFALEHGATRVIVNNGGDIAFRDMSDKPFKVGIPVAEKGQLLLVLPPEMGVGGICTSGFGGRSFSKGIATAVVVLAGSASMADACATHLANCVDVNDPAVVKCRAEEIDSETDIPGQLVTVRVGELSSRAMNQALLNGLLEAESLYERGLIKGCVICLQDKVVKVPEYLEISYRENL